MTKLLCLGIDGISIKMIDELGDQLPNISKLRKKGQSGTLKSVLSSDGLKEEFKNVPFSGPAWTSIYTGLTPEEHGVESASWIKGKNKYASFDKMPETVWEGLNKKGKSVGLFNMPMTYPAKPVVKWMVSGFPEKSMEGIAFPEVTYEYLPYNYWDFTESKIILSEDTLNLEAWLFAEKKRLTTFKKLVDSAPTDVVAYGTVLFDRFCHTIRLSKENIESVILYKEMDSLVGELINAFPTDNIMMFSDHGFEYEPTKKRKTPEGHDYFMHDLDGFYCFTGKDFKSGKIREKSLLEIRPEIERVLL